MRQNYILLDPNNLNVTIQRLVEAYVLSPDTLDGLRRIIALYPHPVPMYVDEANAMLYDGLSLADKFTFDIKTDELVLFSKDEETFIDAFIEMAMYLSGFSTMIGNEEEWVIEFTVGTWKPIKNRIKRQLGITVSDQPRGVVGLPPSTEKNTGIDPYPFRTLVSHYDLGSFYQMVMLAARDDVAVYFPPETHAKVLAVYVYMRREIQEVAQSLSIEDYQVFNSRLIEAVQRLQELFEPANLPPPGWLRSPASRPFDQPDSDERMTHSDTLRAKRDDPFEAFINQLLADEDTDDNGPRV
ncbi:MAG: hypothetical protein JW966_13920 [Anaerolineae bacterium]|nr:hypothetical protein [Anaerolineae bacterium]